VFGRLSRNFEQVRVDCPSTRLLLSGAHPSESSGGDEDLWCDNCGYHTLEVSVVPHVDGRGVTHDRKLSRRYRPE
jgi:hypothetical protein